MDIKEAEEILKGTHCPKCNLSANTLLHNFCTHKVCPVRAALATKFGPREASKFNGKSH